METWKAVPGFPNYEVSNKGLVRRVSKPLVPTIGPSGHLTVSLGRGAKRLVHRLVLEAFVGPPPAGHEGCHSPNHDPGDNRIENLRWDTHAANIADMVRMGRARGGRMPGSKHPNAKVSESDVGGMRCLRNAGATLDRIANVYGLKKQTVHGIVKKTAWKHAGG
jgi:hypothetical protein